MVIAAYNYLLWSAGIEVFGISDTRILAVVVLGLGLAASVSTVVYGVGAGLLRAPKAYPAIASLIGLGALTAGIVTLVTRNETMLATLVIATRPSTRTPARGGTEVREPFADREVR